MRRTILEAWHNGKRVPVAGLICDENTGEVLYLDVGVTYTNSHVPFQEVDIRVNVPAEEDELGSDYYDFLTTILEGIEKALSTYMWNKNQKEYDSPFRNSGDVEGYKNDTFEVHAYNWGDDGNGVNFKWEDVEISWYKYLGRGMHINRPIPYVELYRMHRECINSIPSGIEGE